MLLVESAHRSLRHLSSFEVSPINEFASSEDGLKLGFSFKRNIFGYTDVDLQRI